MAVTTEFIDYLQRTSLPLDDAALTRAASGKVTFAAPAARWLWRVKAVGGKGAPNAPPGERPRDPPSRDMLVGLYGENIPLAFLVESGRQGLSVQIGAWQAGQGGGPQAALEMRAETVAASLRSAYRSAEIVAVKDTSGPNLPVSGMVLGTPTVRPIEQGEPVGPLDRLVRALAGSEWAFLVLAQPVDEEETGRLRNATILEMRNSQATGSTPLARYYISLLEGDLKSLNYGLEIGFWRVGVYLLGTRETYGRLAGIWRGIHSGDESFTNPVRVRQTEWAAKFAQAWALPDAPCPPGPGVIRHPALCQSLLTSRQLAAYVQLPRVEAPGFAVRLSLDFDSEAPAVHGQNAVRLGSVVHESRKTDSPYAIDRDALTRHAFVAGITGSGKTNTVFHLLRQLGAETPFLVLDPAKTEYRALPIQVFTPGDEQLSPFRMNPLEVEGWPKTPVSVHIDLLRSVFGASFGLWAPLPQVLEQALHGVYRDRGWDIAKNDNPRLDRRSDPSDAFPTLSDLVDKVDEVLLTLGYEGKVTDDLRAALLTRLNGLRAGGKGAMLDVQRSFPMDSLLSRSTLIELQALGDDDDKAFVLGLMLVRLYEARRAVGPVEGLRHLLVIEEAHRLLANVARSGDAEQADPRGKAVESFANLLAEIRAYGQGILVIDQSPVKVAPEVIKNTALKIAHQVVASDDRKALAGSMAMSDSQERALAALPQGRAAVFGVGDDAPVLVDIDKAKEGTTLSDADLKTRMDKLADAPKPRPPLAPEVIGLADDHEIRRDFNRMVASMSEDVGALDRLWGDFALRVRRLMRSFGDGEAVLGGLVRRLSDIVARRRGAQNRWTFADTAEFGERLAQTFAEKAAGRNPAPAAAEFRATLARLSMRDGEPFPGCDRVCKQVPQVCLYRRSVEDYAAAELGDRRRAWRAGWERGPENAFNFAREAAFLLLDGDPALDPASKRLELCYAQHMLAPNFGPLHRKMLEELIAAVGGPDEQDKGNAGRT